MSKHNKTIGELAKELSPAADAGPRQPETTKDRLKEMRGLLNQYPGQQGGLQGIAEELYRIATHCVPPVPQEAAPRCPTTGQVKPCNSYVCQFCYPQPKKHKATCNSGLAKYPNGIPEGVNADRNCDCGDRPPVPQEAAPRPLVSVNEPRFNCSECGSSVAESYRSQHVCESAPDICVCGTERNPIGYCKVCDKFYSRPQSAPAPDWAMRVALEIVPSVHENYAFDDTVPEREAVYAHVAAMIRQAGRERLEQSQKFAAQLESNIKFLNERVEAGSERERALEEKLQWAVNWISHGRGRTRCIICDHLVGGHSPGCEVAEASRLLGGESK